MVNEFKVGDQVAHETRGSGVVDRLQETMLSGDLWPVVKLDAGYEWVSNPSSLRPRNFLSKIAEEQETDISPAIDVTGTGVMKDGKHVPHSEVFNPDRFQRNAYGQLVDIVTGLSAESEGLVDISSIKDTVRSIS